VRSAEGERATSADVLAPVVLAVLTWCALTLGVWGGFIGAYAANIGAALAAVISLIVGGLLARVVWRLRLFQSPAGRLALAVLLVPALGLDVAAMAAIAAVTY
jgi:hypothetical protein